MSNIGRETGAKRLRHLCPAGIRVVEARRQHGVRTAVAGGYERRDWPSPFGPAQTGWPRPYGVAVPIEFLSDEEADRFGTDTASYSDLVFGLLQDVRQLAGRPPQVAARRRRLLVARRCLQQPRTSTPRSYPGTRARLTGQG